MSSPSRSLSVLVYGESKVGKSSLAVTAPYPRLLLDVEAAYRFLPINVKKWDPRTEPPVADGTWDTAVVVCRTYDDMRRIYDWLRIGNHQFKSFILDSISELQVKLMEDLVGRGKMQMQQWGEVLQNLTGLMRDIRDLTEHPTNPLEAVVITAMQREGSDGRLLPYLQGQSQNTLPYMWDVVGYLAVEEFPHPDPTLGNYSVRRLYVDKNPKFVSGERVRGKLGKVIEQDNLSVEKMLDLVFGPKPVDALSTELETNGTTNS